MSNVIQFPAKKQAPKTCPAIRDELAVVDDIFPRHHFIDRRGNKHHISEALLLCAVKGDISIFELPDWQYLIPALIDDYLDAASHINELQDRLEIMTNEQ